MTQLWIDVSKWETENGGTKAHVPFNWAAFRAAGGFSATIRATYMADVTYKPTTDAQYLANVADAQAANAWPVSYHLFEMRPGTWQQQADYFLSVADLFNRPAMLDFELAGSVPASDVRAWLEYVATKTGKAPWFYSNPSTIKAHFTAKDTWLRAYPLILAVYNDDPYPVDPLPFFPSDMLGVQFTEAAYAPAYGVQNGNQGCALYEIYQ